MKEINGKEKELATQLETVGRHILWNARNELYLHMRFLDLALSSLEYVMDPEAGTAGVDGNVIHYHTRYLGGCFREDRKLVNRLYLHMVLHCLFCHVFAEPKEDRVLWDLACDIAMESIIDGMEIRCIKRPMSWLRESTYRDLKSTCRVLTAEAVYYALTEQPPDDRKISRMVREFSVDNHGYWCHEEKKPQNEQQRDKWNDIREKMEMDLESFSKEAVEAEGGLRDQLKIAGREEMDYRTFLRKFATLHEELQVDPDQFDYVFYSYGLSMYGNMPLIEPQETKEMMKIEEFAIVIDTSMSCSGDMVRLFLEETYGILKEQESFFRKINVHLIQCDEKVQADVKITSEEELCDYMEHLELAGGGGTDFRPAFSYVEQLCREKEFTNLKGLLYFTDGFGTYPVKMPPFQTAFIFMDQEESNTEVPPWAIRLILDRHQLSAGVSPAESPASGGSQRCADESSFGVRTSQQVRRWRT